MTVALWVILVLLFLAASGFYSGSEMGLYCVNRIRLRVSAEQGTRRDANVLLRLVNRPQETVLVILLGTNLANYLLTVSFSLLLFSVAAIDPEHVDFYSAAILSPVVFVLGDVVPKNCFQLHADRLMHQSARLLQWSLLAFRLSGILWLLHQMTRVSARLAGHDERADWQGARGEVVGLLREGAAVGALTEEQARIIERVMNLSSVRVGSIMIPRGHLATIPVDADRRMFEQVVRQHYYSRLPVVGRDRRTVVGIVDVFDVLADEGGGTVEQWLRPHLEIAARESATRALVQLRRARQTMAIITDPRRGFVGIVTLKDVVEAIFGELPAW